MKDPFAAQDLNSTSYSPGNNKSYREREPPAAVSPDFIFAARAWISFVRHRVELDGILTVCPV